MSANVVLQHIQYLQVFYADYVVLAYEARQQLMQEVLSLVGDVLVQSCNFDPLDFASLAALWLSGQFALKS